MSITFQPVETLFTSGKTLYFIIRGFVAGVRQVWNPTLNTMTSGGGIEFLAGSTFTALSGSDVQIYLATASVTGLSTSQTNTGWAGCNIAGSTMTISVSTTTRGFVTFNGVIGETAVAGGAALIWAVVDGKFFPGFTASNPNCVAYNSSSNTYPCSFALMTNPLAAGVHSFCLGIGAGGTSQTVQLYNAACGNSVCGGNSFQVVQLPILN